MILGGKHVDSLFCCCRRKFLRFLAELQVLSLNNVLHIWILFKLNSLDARTTNKLDEFGLDSWRQAHNKCEPKIQKLHQLHGISSLNCSVSIANHIQTRKPGIRLEHPVKLLRDFVSAITNLVVCICWRWGKDVETLSVVAEENYLQILSRTLGAITPSCPAYPNTLQISLHASPYRQETIWKWRKSLQSINTNS